MSNIIGEKEINDLMVETDGKFVSIKSLVKKRKEQIWIVKTKNHSLECADKHILFKANYEEVFVKDLNVGDKIITKDGVERVIFVKATERLDYVYDLVLGEDSQQRYYTDSILSHNSTIYTVFALHYCLFNSDKSILLCANKEKTVKDLLGRIKLAYMKLPSFLKIGVTNWSAKEIEFENGSKISITATSSDSARGTTCDVCFDENSWFVCIEDGEVKQLPLHYLLEKSVKLVVNNEVAFKELLQSNLDNLIYDNELLEMFLNNIETYKQLNYHIENANLTIPKCPICGKSLIKRFDNKKHCYKATCSANCQKKFNKKYGNNIGRLKILTPSGFKVFSSISINVVDELIKVNNNSYSKSHKLFTTSGVKEVQDLTFADILVSSMEYVFIRIENIENIFKKSFVYDIVNVDDNDHLFFNNNIINHNCILDEAAIVPENLMEDFVQAVFPTIASRPDGKIIAVSTPKASTNWFGRTYHKAIYQQGEGSIGDVKKNKNDDPFKWNAITFPWYEHPERDEAWAKKQLSMFGNNVKKFKTEFECAFLGSSITLFDPQVIEHFKKIVISSDDESNFREESINDRNVVIYQEPKENHTYILGVDIADGSGEDYSVLQCWDVTDVKNLELVFTFGSNTISIPEFVYISAKLGARYNYALISGERNGVGTAFFEILWETFEYENVVSYVNDEEPAIKPGIYSTNKNKLKACLWAKNFLLLCTGDKKIFNIDIPDTKIIYEMETFERKNKTGTITYAASKNMHDDYVMCFIWAIFPLIINIAEMFLEVKTSIKTDFGLEIPTSFRNIYDPKAYTEQFIDSKFGGNRQNNIDYNESNDDKQKRELISNSIYGAILGGDFRNDGDNW